MRFSLFLAGAALFAATAVTAKHDQIHARAPTHVSGAAFPELQARVNHNADGDLQIRGGPSRTTSSEMTNNEKRTIRVNSRSAAIRVKAVTTLRICSGGVSASVVRIKQGCGGASSANIKVVIKLLLAELYVILALCKQCLGEIKGCGNVPTPSMPPSNPPSPWEICQCLIEIITLLHGCFIQLIFICGKFPLARTACAGVLVEISACLCEILRSCESVVGGGLLVLIKLNASSVIGQLNGLSFGGGFGLSSVFSLVNGF